MRRLLVVLTLLACVAVPNAADATPPEGCVGFPSIPEAFLCVTQFSPANVVPAVSPGPGQTFVIPEFCVFECVGPTPVTVPNVVITAGDGVVAVITYDGTTYPVVVPSASSAGETVAAAEQAMADTLATALATAGGVGRRGDNVFVLSGSMHVYCFGCAETAGTLSATATGRYQGQPIKQTVPGSFTMYGPQGATCLLTGSASGVIGMPDGDLDFNLTLVGGVVLLTYFRYGGPSGEGVGTFTVTSPLGIACGGPAEAMFTASVRLA